MKENIDKYYLVLVSMITDVEKHISKEHIIDEWMGTDPIYEINYKIKNCKYTIVSRYEDIYGYGWYKDLLSNKYYQIKATTETEVGDLIINIDFGMIPLNHILNLNEQKIRKSKLLKNM